MGDENVRAFWRSNNTIPMEISIAEASAIFPGFRFSPTDEELIRFYLKKKLEGSDKDVEVIPEVDICRHEPWDLPAQSVIHSENEWFFFSPRGKKYPNGSQSKRATESGYWKATGKERSVKSCSHVIGTKRTLVFHTGRAPKGQRTEWIMHEYCTSEKSQDGMVVCRLRKNSEFHLNDNSRRNSVHQEDHVTALSGCELSGLLDGHGPKLADGYPKECSSSYNSHSVEQADSGSDSDEKQPDGFFQQDYSSQKKSCVEEDDCYADIMKDDIIKLDDSTSDAIPLTTPLSAGKLKQPALNAVASVLPFQGTSNRRIRLRRHKVRLPYSERLEVCKLGELGDPSFFIDQLTLSWSNLPFLFVFMFLMIVLVLYMFFVSDPFHCSPVRH